MPKPQKDVSDSYTRTRRWRFGDEIVEYFEYTKESVGGVEGSRAVSRWISAPALRGWVNLYTGIFDKFALRAVEKELKHLLWIKE